MIKFPKITRPSALTLSWCILGLVTLGLVFLSIMGKNTSKESAKNHAYVKITQSVDTNQDPQLPADESVQALPHSVDSLPAWQENASHIGADLDESHPRIAIVINGLGIDENLTRDALERMPAEVTFAFLPYVTQLQTFIDAARAKKHEVLLSIPMEPLSYPRNDPGPYSLLTKGGEKNITRMHWILKHAKGYVGVTNYMGSLFTTSAEDLQPILDIVKEQGLMYLDINETVNSLAGGMAQERKIPTVSALVSLHEDLNKVSIDHRLSALEEEAKRSGIAIATTNPSPLVFDRLLTWIEGLKEKGIALVPLTATIRSDSPHPKVQELTSLEPHDEEEDDEKPQQAPTAAPDKPALDKPTADKPALDKPTADKPAPDKPAPDKPAPDKPAPDKPAADKPAPDKPTPEKPTSDKPTQENPTDKKTTP